MSQAELAGGEVSASFISLVESGRRTPSRAIAQAIADRLGVSLDEFGVVGAVGMVGAVGVVEAAAGGGRDDLVRRLVVARSARAEGRFECAAAELTALADDADAKGERDAAWEARWELAETYGDLDRPAERDTVLRRLLDDPLTDGSVRLRARVAAAIAELALGLGRLAEAVRAGEQAASAAGTLDVGTHEWGRAQLALIGAYTARDDLDRATAAAERMLQDLDELPTDRLRGLACWAAADVHMADGRPAEALPLLRRAAELLPPRTDLRQLARLVLTTAMACVGSDEAMDTVDELLGFARHAFSLAGSPADQVRLASVDMVVLAHRGQSAAATARAACVRPVPGLPPHELAQGLLAVGGIQVAVGRPAQAEQSYRRAAELFDEVGAYRRAAQAWRTLVDVMAAQRNR